MSAGDRDDVLQECLIGAVVASREGRYRPAPSMKPRYALQRWLVGIAVRQAGKYHEKAYRRREVAVAEPLALVADQGRCIQGQFEARAVLRVLYWVPARERVVLVLVGEGEQVTEIARNLKVPIGTAFSRFRRGRKRLAVMLTRWQRGR